MTIPIKLGIIPTSPSFFAVTMQDYSYISRVSVPARHLPLVTGVENLTLPRLIGIKAVEARALLKAILETDALLERCAGKNLPAGLDPERILPFFCHRAAAALAAERKIAARIIATDPNSDLAFVARQRTAFYAHHKPFVVQHSGFNHTWANHPSLGPAEEVFVRKELADLKGALTTAFTSCRAVATICSWLVGRLDAMERAQVPKEFGILYQVDPFRAAAAPFREQLKFLSPAMLLKFPAACRHMFEGESFEPMARVAMLGIAALLRGVPRALRTTAIPGRTLLEDLDVLGPLCDKRALSGQGMYDLSARYLELTGLWAAYRACDRHVGRYGQSAKPTHTSQSDGKVSISASAVAERPEFSFHNLRLPLSLAADRTATPAKFPRLDSRSLFVRDAFLPIALVTERAVHDFESNGHFQFPAAHDQAAVEPFVQFRAAYAVRAERAALAAVQLDFGPVADLLSDRRATIAKYEGIVRVFGNVVSVPEALPLMTKDVEVFVLRQMKERRGELREAFVRSPAVRVILGDFRQELVKLSIKVVKEDLSDSPDPESRWLSNLKNYAGEFEHLSAEEIRNDPGSAGALLFDQLFAQSAKRIMARLEGVVKDIPKLLAASEVADDASFDAITKLAAIEKRFGQPAYEILCQYQLMRVLYQDYATCRQYTSHTNSRLQRSVAKRFLFSGFDFDDLLGFARHGFFKGVDRHKEDGKGKISTYVTRWMEQTLRFAIWEEKFLIHLPSHIKKLSSRIDEIFEEADQADQLRPTPEELVKLTGRPLEEIQGVLVARGSLVDIDRPMGDPDGRTMGETVLHTDPADNPNEVLDQHALLEEAMSKVLRPREQKVLKMLVGFDDGIPKERKEIGRELRITKERVRQIINHSLAKLQESSYYEKLKVFVNTFAKVADDAAESSEAA